MRIRKTTWVWLVPAALFAVLLHTTSALAAEPVSLTIQAPKQVNLGDEVKVAAVLTDNQRRPIPGASILLLAPGDFLSVESEVELDRATTDPQGTASLRYQARTENSVTLTASFPGNSQYSPSRASTDITINGSVQLYQQTPGVLHGLQVWWLLVGVLGVAWSIFFGVAVLLIMIARADMPALER